MSQGGEVYQLLLQEIQALRNEISGGKNKSQEVAEVVNRGSGVTSRHVGKPANSPAPLNRAAKAILDNEFHKGEWANVNLIDDHALSFLVHDEARYHNLANRHKHVNMMRFDRSFIDNVIL